MPFSAVVPNITWAKKMKGPGTLPAKTLGRERL
jgi:hypothetical protein